MSRTLLSAATRTSSLRDYAATALLVVAAALPVAALFGRVSPAGVDAPTVTDTYAQR